MRWVMARVLPVPAPASTHIGPLGCAATSRCSGSRASRTASAPGCTGRVVIATILGVGGDAAVAPTPCGRSAATHRRRPGRGKQLPSRVFTPASPRPDEEPDVRRRAHRPDAARARNRHHVHDDLVRLLPTAEVADGARGHRLHRGRHRARAGHGRVRHVGQRRQPDGADAALPRRLGGHQPVDRPGARPALASPRRRSPHSAQRGSPASRAGRRTSAR